MIYEFLYDFYILSRTDRQLKNSSNKTKELLRMLIKLGDEVNQQHPTINSGGCCFFAFNVAKELESIGIEAEVITPILKNSKSPKQVRKKINTPFDWVANGLCINHLGVRFRTKEGHIYSYDSCRLSANSKVFSDNNIPVNVPFGDGMTPKEAEELYYTDDIWNPKFNVEECPYVESIIKRHFQEFKINEL